MAIVLDFGGEIGGRQDAAGFDAHEERGAAVHHRSESWPPAEGTEYTKGVAVMRGRGRLPPPFTRPLGWKEILMHTKCQLRRTGL